MTLSIENCDEDIRSYTEWAVENKLWDGRTVSWLEASDFCEEVHAKIFELLSTEQKNGQFESFAAQLAWIGGNDSSRSLLVRDIQELCANANGVYLPAGWIKSALRWVAKHKKEILIGAAIVAVVTVVVVVAVCSGGTAAAGAGALGAAALDGLTGEDNPETPPLPYQPTPAKIDTASEPISLPPLTDAPGKVVFGESGLTFNNQYTAYRDILQNTHSAPFLENLTPPPVVPGRFEIDFESTRQPHQPPTTSKDTALEALREKYAGTERPSFSFDFDAPSLDLPYSLPPTMRDYGSNIDELFAKPKNLPPESGLPIDSPSTPPLQSSQERSWMRDFVDGVRDVMIDPDFRDPAAELLSSVEFSRYIPAEGKRVAHMDFVMMNGMNTTADEAFSHVEYLKQWSNEHAVDLLYNHSNGLVVDLAEIFGLNYKGVSPNTVDLLDTRVKNFHTANQDRPNAKMLVTCHSQGCIHLKNYLKNTSEELRNRLIVIAVAPGAVIPNSLCYKSHNFACTTDVVPYGEIAANRSPSGIPAEVFEHHNELVWLNPLPGDSWFNHNFQNPAFEEIISDIMKDYLTHEGEYP